MVNTIFTNVGAAKIISWFAGNTETPPSHIAYGSDNTAPSKSNTTINNELSRKVIETTTSDNTKIKYSMIIVSSESNGNNLKEVGLFNASTAGDLFMHSTHATIAKTSQIEVEYEITLRVIN